MLCQVWVKQRGSCRRSVQARILNYRLPLLPKPIEARRRKSFPPWYEKGTSLIFGLRHIGMSSFSFSLHYNNQPIFYPLSRFDTFSKDERCQRTVETFLNVRRSPAGARVWD